MSQKNLLEEQEKEETAKELSFKEFIQQFKVSFKATKSMLLSLCWVFVVTFIVFNAAFVKAGFDFNKSDDETQTQLLDQTTVNLIFNCLDTLGRYLGGKFILSRRATMALSLLRTVFLFTTLATAVQMSPGWLFRADWFRLVNLILFSLSNGYVSTLCIIIGPSLVKEKEQQQQVGLFGSIFLCLGITIGSIINIPVGFVYN